MTNLEPEWPMSRLSESVERSMGLLATADLASDDVVEKLLAETTDRRRLDLADLTPPEQAHLVASRALDVLPSAERLAESIERAASAGRPLIVKFGIDPTAEDVHIGHAVPMMVASRLQRMGHRVVFIVGDITGKIGDPSGRSGERPSLSDEDIARHLRTYREQVSPFFDFDRAELRHNSEWLAQVRLPELLGILAQIPVSASLQREDFRNRLGQGHGLSMSEFLYSVVMAMDSVAIHCDVEIGGLDQLLNMQMCRRVMEVVGQPPELVIATPLIEGTDGTGAKMSKSRGNSVALNSPPEEIYGRVMSVPDRLAATYLQALSEWTDVEVAEVVARQEAGTLHPMDLKRIVAGEVVAAVHGVDAAMRARADFSARFSRRSYAEVETMPVLDLTANGGGRLGETLTGVLALTPSISAARRVAEQGGLRLVVEAQGRQDSVTLPAGAVARPVGEVVAEVVAELRPRADAKLYVKVGRKLARITGAAIAPQPGPPAA